MQPPDSGSATGTRMIARTIAITTAKGREMKQGVLLARYHRTLLVVTCAPVSAALVASVWAAPTPPVLTQVPLQGELVVQQGHRGSIYDVAWSPDGRTIATASADQTVRLWDAASGGLKRVLPGHTYQVHSVAFAPDGKTLAAGDGGVADGSATSAVIRLWDVQTGKLKRTLRGLESEVRSLQFSPDGKSLIGSMNNIAALWDVSSGKMLFPRRRNNTDAANDMAFSPDGQTIATATFRQVQLWDAGMNQVTAALLIPAHGRPEVVEVEAIAFSSDGAFLASSDAAAIRLWDLQTGKIVRAWPNRANTKTITSGLSFSPDGSLLAVANIGWPHETTNAQGEYAAGEPLGAVRVLQTATGKEQWRRAGMRGGVYAIRFSPDGRAVASGGATVGWPGLIGELSLRDARSGALQWVSSGYYEAVNSIKFASDGKSLASGGDDTAIRLWNSHTGQLARTLKRRSPAIKAVAFSRDGSTLAAAEPDAVALWRVRDGKLQRMLAAGKDNYGLSGVAFSPDGTQVASGGVMQGEHWEARTGRRLKPIHGDELHTYNFDALMFSANGKTLWGVINGQIGTIHQWDARTAKLLRQLDATALGSEAAHDSPIGGMAFLPNGNLVSGGWDATLKLWNVPANSIRRTLRGHTGMVAAVAVAPDGKTIASGSADRTVRLWDAIAVKPLRTLAGHTARVSSVSFSADGKILASGSYDGTIKLWNPRTGQLRVTLVILPAQPVTRIVALKKPEDLMSVTPRMWLAFTPEGYYDGSPGAEKFIRWRAQGATGDQLFPAADYARSFRRPDLVRKALRDE